MHRPTAKQEFRTLLPPGLVADADSLFESLHAVARTPYEGRPCMGSILIHPDIAAPSLHALAFAAPIGVPNTPGLRKLLELSNRAFPLLFDGRRFHGFFPVERASQHLRIVFRGPDGWNVELDGIVRLSVTNMESGVPTFDNTLSKMAFTAHLKRVFDRLDADRIETIWSIATVALDQPFGTNILFTPKAQTESQRLSAECIPIAPTPLTPTLVRTFALIDGTTIADLDGHVHAVSAILDGDTSYNGSWERGGRYNSAVNYLCHHPTSALILSVSQDGGIEILPPIGYDSDTWTQHRYRKLNSIVT